MKTAGRARGHLAKLPLPAAGVVLAEFFGRCCLWPHWPTYVGPLRVGVCNLLCYLLSSCSVLVIAQRQASLQVRGLQSRRGRGDWLIQPDIP